MITHDNRVKRFFSYCGEEKGVISLNAQVEVIGGWHCQELDRKHGISNRQCCQFGIQCRICAEEHRGETDDLQHLKCWEFLQAEWPVSLEGKRQWFTHTGGQQTVTNAKDHLRAHSALGVSDESMLHESLNGIVTRLYRTAIIGDNSRSGMRGVSRT